MLLRHCPPPSHGCGLAELELPDPTRGTAQPWEPVRTGGLGKPRQHLALLLPTLPALLLLSLFPHPLCSPRIICIHPISPPHMTLHSPHSHPHIPYACPSPIPTAAMAPSLFPVPAVPSSLPSIRAAGAAAQQPSPAHSPRASLSVLSAPRLLHSALPQACCPCSAAIPPSSPGSQEEQLSHPPMLSQDISWVKDSPGITDPAGEVLCGALSMAKQLHRAGSEQSAPGFPTYPGQHVKHGWMDGAACPPQWLPSPRSHRRICPLAWEGIS